MQCLGGNLPPRLLLFSECLPDDPLFLHARGSEVLLPISRCGFQQSCLAVWARSQAFRHSTHTTCGNSLQGNPHLDCLLIAGLCWVGMVGTIFPSYRLPTRSLGPEAPHDHIEVHVEAIDFDVNPISPSMELLSAGLQLQSGSCRGPETT